MSRYTIRKNRKRGRRCDMCFAPILRGELYGWSVISPNHGDVGNTGWWGASECEACSTRYGRWPVAPSAPEDPT